MHVVFAALVMLACTACQREKRDDPFVGSLRCGMTRMEVGRLAREHGYNSSEKSWLARSAKSAGKSKELSLIDLTFRGGQLVAYTESRYDPRTKKTTSRVIDLCGKSVR